VGNIFYDVYLLTVGSLITVYRFETKIMPTYDYVCDACGHEFEEFQYIKEEHLKKCPQCKKMKLRRLIGAGGGIVFKGSGFYQTDYRSESYKKGESAATSSSTITSAKSEKKTESKTQASGKASDGTKS